MLRVVLLLILICLPILPAGAGVRETVRALAPGALVLVVDESGEILVSQNANKPFIPASVAKVVTAWLALGALGPDYRFETRFYLDGDRTLYLRGGGDPFLVSEELALLAPKLLNAAGRQPFRAMVLDTSHYPGTIAIPGIEKDDEAYNALNSALAVNFNTIHAVRSGDTVRSAEDQTPITPLAIDQFRKRGPNGRGRISLAQEDPALGALYAGELLAEFLKRSGGEVRGAIAIGRVPNGLKPVYVHRQSRPLSEIVRQMLDLSNNYIANQIFLEAGARAHGSPVSLEKSRRLLDQLLRQRGLENHFKMVEGSGISPDTLMTSHGLAALLDAFAPHAGLLKRNGSGSRYKTGTMPEASTLAGYARTTGHGLVRFVIALPGRSGNLRFRILKTIEKEL